jgi:hypothetical protein
MYSKTAGISETNSKNRRCASSSRFDHVSSSLGQLGAVFAEHGAFLPTSVLGISDQHCLITPCRDYRYYRRPRAPGSLRRAVFILGRLCVVAEDPGVSPQLLQAVELPFSWTEYVNYDVAPVQQDPA